MVEGEPGYVTEVFAREAVGFIENRAEDEPWFLFLSFNAVHDPMEAAEEYLARFEHNEPELTAQGRCRTSK